MKAIIQVVVVIVCMATVAGVGYKLGHARATVDERVKTLEAVMDVTETSVSILRNKQAIIEDLVNKLNSCEDRKRHGVSL